MRLECCHTSAQFIGFCRGNSIKYASRAGKKTGADASEDLKKASFYTNYEIDFCRRLETGSIGEDRVMNLLQTKGTI